MNNFFVKDLMTANPFTLQPSDSLEDAIELMQWRRIRHLPVVSESGKLLGLLSHRDCLNLSFSELSEVDDEDAIEIYQTVPVQEVMHRKLLTTTPTQSLRDAAQVLYDDKIGCLPVVDPNTQKLVGILTESDFVRIFAKWPTLHSVATVSM